MVLRSLHRDSRAVVRLAIPLPQAEMSTDPGRLSGPPAISPDGKAVVIPLGLGPGLALWMRRLDSDGFERLAGTEGGTMPFWSPDGRQIGFFAHEKLQRMEVRVDRRRCFAPVQDPEAVRVAERGTLPEPFSTA
jgi:hypothetical protein